jgi:hypothetical protein
MEIDLETFNFNRLQEYIDENRLKNMGNIPLFHYTNIEAFTNILKTNTLWATNCEYLNDLTELMDIERLYNNLIEKNDNKFGRFVSLIKNDFFETAMKNLRKQTYIISFSKDEDSIAMWRNYGKNGIVLEFDSQVMIKTVKTDEINIIDKNNTIVEISTMKRFGDAIYDDSEIIKIISLTFESLKRIDEFNNPIKEKEISDNLIKVLFDTLFGAYIQKKDKNFSYENEFRMAFALNDNDVGKVENFRIKNNLLIPYLIIDFKHNGHLPIKSIMINPEQKDFMYENGMRHLLKAYNYDIQIKYSSSQIR